MPKLSAIAPADPAVQSPAVASSAKPPINLARLLDDLNLLDAVVQDQTDWMIAMVDSAIRALAVDALANAGQVRILLMCVRYHLSDVANTVNGTAESHGANSTDAAEREFSDAIGAQRARLRGAA